MLGVFLLPAFTLPRYECSDLWSPCDGMHLGLYWNSVYTLHPSQFLGNGVRTQFNSKEKNPLPEGSKECLIREAASSRIASPTHYRLSYSGPLFQSMSVCSVSLACLKGHRVKKSQNASTSLTFPSKRLHRPKRILLCRFDIVV